MTNQPNTPASQITGRRIKLDAGLEMLTEWSETATQAHRNVVYRALFAVAEGSVYRTFQTMTYRGCPGQLTVVCRDDLVLTITHSGAETFDIAYVGSPLKAFDLGHC